MAAAIMRAEISIKSEIPDSNKIKTELNTIRRFAVRGKSVVARLNSNDSNTIHVKYARRYSSNIQDLEKEIWRINSLLIIAALRSQGLHVYTLPFDDEEQAFKFLRKAKFPTIAIV